MVLLFVARIDEPGFSSVMLGPRAASSLVVPSILDPETRPAARVRECGPGVTPHAQHRLRKRSLTAELATLADLEKVASLDAERIKRDLRSRVSDVRGLLGRHLPQTRQILRKLVVGRVECEPFKEGGRRGYRVSGHGTYARLLPGGECATSLDFHAARLA